MSKYIFKFINMNRMIFQKFNHKQNSLSPNTFGVAFIWTLSKKSKISPLRKQTTDTEHHRPLPPEAIIIKKTRKRKTEKIII